MPQTYLQTAFEPDEVKSPVPGMAVQLTLHAPGEYRATFAGLQLDRMWLVNAEDNAARTVRVKLPDMVVFAMLPGMQPSVLAGGMEFKHTQLNQHRPGRDYHQTTRGPTLTAALMIAPEQLRELAGRLGVNLPPRDRNQIIDPRPYALQRLMRLHVGAMRLVRDPAGLVARSEAMRGLENALAEGLAACLREAGTQAMTGAQRSHEAILHRFNDLLAANADKSLFMADICAALGTSARTLRACCEQQIGMGPKQFLILRRMHLVRRALLGASPAMATVTDIATGYGFWELGRFAVAYRQMFGELPSATLRRWPDSAPPDAAAAPRPAPAWAGTRWEAALAWFHAAEGGKRGAIPDLA